MAGLAADSKWPGSLSFVNAQRNKKHSPLEQLPGPSLQACMTLPACMCCFLQVPQWSRRQHHLFPRPLRLAVRELLLIARCRGFPAAAAPQSRLGLEGAVHTQRLPEPPAETQAAETLQAMPPLLLPQDTVRDEAQQAQRLGRGCVQQGAQPQRRHVEHEEADMQEQEVSPGRGKQREVQQRDPGQRDQGTRVVWLDDNVLDCVFRHLARVYYH